MSKVSRVSNITIMKASYTAAIIFCCYVRYCAAYLSSECSDYQCAMRRDQRRDCSPKENKRDNCLALGCCFDNSVYDTIWCFYPLSLPQGRCPHPECQVLPEDRMPCFASHIYVSRSMCSGNGCCYDEDSYGAPKCFMRKVRVIAFTGFSVGLNSVSQQNCDRVDPFQRKRCGGVRTTQEQCTRFRCCWVEIWLAGPRCFSPQPSATVRRWMQPSTTRRRFLF
ncbi:uncharacterized protein LOC120339532 isoform X1 [Styela clava]